MTWVVAVLAFWTWGGMLSVLARRDWPPLRLKSVQVVAIVGFFALFTVAIRLLSGGTNMSLLFLFPIMIVGIGCAALFGPYVIKDWFESGHRWATGIDSMKIEKSYDRAEKAERDREYDEAVRMYRAECERDPADPEPWRRIGEIEMRRNRPAEAIEPLRAALARLREPEPRATAAFRLADVLARIGRPDEAREAIETVAREFPGTRFESFAKERLKTFSERADN